MCAAIVQNQIKCPLISRWYCRILEELKISKSKCLFPYTDPFSLIPSTLSHLESSENRDPCKSGLLREFRSKIGQEPIYLRLTMATRRYGVTDPASYSCHQTMRMIRCARSDWIRNWSEA
jgi:hypothetical protein